MADRGIIFSAPLVRALLAARKTQTRRLLTSARVFGAPESPAFTLKCEHLTRALQGASGFRHLGGDSWAWSADAFEYQAPAERTEWLAHIGHAPGDRLYVREGYYQFGHWEPVAQRRTKGGRQKWAFVPDSAEIRFDTPEVFRKGRHTADPATPAWHARLGRFMPRCASRMWLAVTDVRVQRLQEISEADAIAEGLEWCVPGKWSVDRTLPIIGDDPRLVYADLWDTLHTEPVTRWTENPWIVATSFTVHHGNIDAGAQTHV